MRVAFADGATLGIGDIGTKDNVVQGETGGRAVGEVADGHSSRSTAVTTVETDGCGQKQANLLCKSTKSTAGIARVFVVHFEFFLGRAIRAGFIVAEVCTQRLVVGNRGV
ncbi:hypothetical protein KCU83_g74, partial [Aureobasidium melanogenum]